ncbi:Leucine-rich repeat-containing protein 71 [Taenia crassiceps]|uniref:Leucine-rich repeat-containing protein 71 n=1 Tax=Taenia crassiceps TaxID=6207 RepID=A0ABR4QKK0_9CEST
MENNSDAPDQSQFVQYLNYKRMGRGCLQAAEQVPNAGSTLVFLDLSGNKLGDEDVCNLAKILRINRTIRAISLSNNCLSDIGVEALCEVATAFTLTSDELAMRRLLKMKMILDDSSFLDMVKARLDLENDASTLGQITASAVRKHQNRKKGATRKLKAQRRGKEGIQTTRKDPKVNEHMRPTEKDSQPLKNEDYASSNPLLAKEEGKGPFGMRIRGNYQLAMLNLSRNLITDFGVNLLTKALSIQTSSLTEGSIGGSVGLTDILLKGNKFDETGVFYKNLLVELQRKKDLIGKHDDLNYTRLFATPSHAQEKDRAKEEGRKEQGSTERDSSKPF